ncbi:MAG: hypothetical protein PHP45_10035, partial [Elusimicrobiales bacterium]|nr:hypothetical protein [Elusimicrobiales bacterium]
NGLDVILSEIALPTPVFSFALMNGLASACLNGTASHNPPSDMGLKYNPSTGGPASSETTALIEKYANEFLDNPALVKRITLAEAKKRGLVRRDDLVTPYVERMGEKVDMSAIKSGGLRIGIHALGGASAPFYDALAARYGLSNLELVNREVDPCFGFIPLDHDGKIRMDPSSQYPMSPLIELVKTGKYDFAGASDPDADRFGAATAKAGLVQPNHALSVLFNYLLSNRPSWPAALAAGRTIGTTHLLDKIAAAAGRGCDETDVGFKHFVPGFSGGRYLMAGEESAGLSVYGWTTEKDGILAVMLLAEAMSKTGRDIAELYADITARFGAPSYRRADMPINDAMRAKIKSLKASSFAGGKIAGEKILRARDSDGIKLYLEDSWVLVRMSGTEPIAKIYAETFRGPEQLEKVLLEGARAFGISG